MEGSNVVAPWSAYTDHNPVELILRVGKHWCSHTVLPKKQGMPDVAKMRGQEPEATALRNQWVSKLEDKLANYAGTPHWEEICTLCRETAIEICGY